MAATAPYAAVMTAKIAVKMTIVPVSVIMALRPPIDASAHFRAELGVVNLFATRLDSMSSRGGSDLIRFGWKDFRS